MGMERALFADRERPQGSRFHDDAPRGVTSTICSLGACLLIQVNGESEKSRTSFNRGNEAMSDFMEKMVALTDGVHSDLVVLPDERARYDLVKQIIDSAEVVFAVWTDRFAQDGVGHMLLKGQAIARQAVADKKMAVSTRVAAIPCNSAEQAEALLHELGERDSRH